MNKHKLSYIICATPRSGSTLLCDLLTDTGVAGHPNSFFRRESFPEWANHFNVSVAEWRDEHEFDQSYLSAVLQRGADGTPVFGMRLMWESLDDLSQRLEAFYPNLSDDSARFQSAFRSPLYLHLSRADKVAQAVSLLRAEQSGLWHVFADGTERERLSPVQTPVYDAHGISKCLAELEEHDTAWERWFSEQAIEPLSITYEALSTEPQSALAAVLSGLDLDPAIAGTVKPKSAKLADTESHDWITRFRTEHNG